MKQRTDQMSVSPSAVARVLGAIAFLLVLASIGGQIAKYRFGYDYVKGAVALFHVDAERNIPTFFSVSLILCAALLLSMIAVLSGKRSSPDTSKWIILSFGFMAMAYDEAFSIHEKMIVPIRTLLGDDDLGIFYFAWVIPGIALILFLGLFFSKFILRLPAISRVRFLIAAAFYIGGAIGVELIGGRYAESHGQDNLSYSMLTTVEESLEMTGLIIFIWALLKYFASTYEDVHIRFLK